MVVTAPVPRGSQTPRHQSSPRRSTGRLTPSQRDAHLQRVGYRVLTPELHREQELWRREVEREAQISEWKMERMDIARAELGEPFAYLLEEVLRLRLELEAMKQQRDAAIEMCAAAEEHSEFLLQQINAMLDAHNYSIAYREAMES